MHRFYLAAPKCLGPKLLLSGREAHHALHVLRLRRGARVEVLDGEGQVLSCEIAHPGRDRLELNVLERTSVAAPPYQITLGQAVPKGKLFEFIVQKATELGAYRLVPLLTEHTVSRLEPGDAEHKLEKWRAVALEAMKQCGSPWLPRIELPSSIETFLSWQTNSDLALVGSLRRDSRHPRDCFEQYVQRQGRTPRSVSVAVGPEGDFTDQELLTLQTAGAQPITLGRLVLRTDTAAVYCLSVVHSELEHRAGPAATGGP